MIKKEITTINYDNLINRIGEILTAARSKVVREINKAQVLEYWEIGREIVEFEQKGKARAEYGEELIVRLSKDMTQKFGRGFSGRNLWNMKALYLNFPILQTPSAESSKTQKYQTPSDKSTKKQKSETPSRKSTIRQTPSVKFEPQLK